MSRVELPWPYVGSATGTIPNEPSPEGELLGREMARICDYEAARQPDAKERCHDCALRLGTIPNKCGATLMDLTKCAFENEPFYCHVNDGELCAGYLILKRAK